MSEAGLLLDEANPIAFIADKAYNIGSYIENLKHDKSHRLFHQ